MKKSFTLIELLVVLLIISLIIGLVAPKGAKLLDSINKKIENLWKHRLFMKHKSLNNTISIIGQYQQAVFRYHTSFLNLLQYVAYYH